MLIENFVWAQIRHEFTEDEKATLRGAVDKQMSPRMGANRYWVDVHKLPKSLREKLLGLYKTS